MIALAASPMPSFIETQFPVSRLSKESYKERKSNYSQTLTGLGKWWGRKPLILCRATILGLLLPTSDDPQRDREVFLKLLTMDEEGFLRRFKGIPPKKVRSEFATAAEVAEWDRIEAAWRGAQTEEKKAARAALDAYRADLERRVFLRLRYEEQLEFCDRPEQVDGPSAAAWAEINAHLGTSAASLPELVRQLGEQRFGRVPRVGDAFCGGGSIPFEAARIGCEAYGSDLNPVAALLTWAALHIVGGGEEVATQVRRAQREIYDAVDRQVTAWGIEHRTEEVDGGDWRRLVEGMQAGKLTPEDIHRRVPRADAYLYCVEVVCPETGWSVPLAPSWVIGEKSRCVAKLVPDPQRKRYDIRIESGVSDAEMAAAKAGTVKGGYVIHPMLKELGKDPASIDQVRLAGKGRDPAARYHDNGLRLWENDDLVPRPDDVFQERLYCVRWVEWFERPNARGETVWDTRKEYRAPTGHDLAREAETLRLLGERFHEWQREGFVPAMKIEPGYNTDQPIRERGWTHWHHLFNPRQLLTLGAFVVHSVAPDKDVKDAVMSLLGVMKSADNNSKLSGWCPLQGKELVDHVFANQALNTLSNHGVRAIQHLASCYVLSPKTAPIAGSGHSMPADGRLVDVFSEYWITDPPYADAVNYHELADFFMCWIAGAIRREFPEWYRESRRALAVTGSDDNFRRSMVDCYRNLAAHMPEEGMQVVMFTHQSAAVWADLALILWAAGLRVTAAWCIATETDSALKEGNYVQGTVLLVLRKQTGDETAFLDEVHPQVEAEVKRQLDALHDLDERHATSPDFADTDYQLAAYAAALRVLTRYARIEDINVERELARQRRKGEAGELEKLIGDAVRIACDHLVPAGFDRFVWKTLGAAERFYLKGLDLESHGEFRAGAYQELARGFGLREYKDLLGSGKANEVRLKTATEFGRRSLGDADDPFAAALTRQVLFAVREVAAGDEGNAEPGLAWLRAELKDFWAQRKAILEILRYLARFEHTIESWQADAHAAAVLAGAVENVGG